jgi:RNA polymerase sigma factor (sigma-70 family)
MTTTRLIDTRQINYCPGVPRRPIDPDDLFAYISCEMRDPAQVRPLAVRFDPPSGQHFVVCRGPAYEQEGLLLEAARKLGLSGVPCIVVGCPPPPAAGAVPKPSPAPARETDDQAGLLLHGRPPAIGQKAAAPPRPPTRGGPTRECLVERLPRLTSFLRGRGFSRHVAETAALEAVAVATRYLDTGRAHQLRHRVAWLYTVAYFAAVRAARADPPCVCVPIEELERFLRTRRSTGPDPALTSAVQEALSVLSRRQRRAVELYVLGGLSFRDAADALGVSVGAFRTHIRRALSRLRQELTELLPPRFNNRARV